MSKNFRKGFRELFCRTERRIIIIGGEPYQPRTDTVQVCTPSHLTKIEISFLELMLTFHLYKNKLRLNRCQQRPATSDAYSDSLPLPEVSTLYVHHK